MEGVLFWLLISFWLTVNGESNDAYFEPPPCLGGGCGNGPTILVDAALGIDSTTCGAAATPCATLPHAIDRVGLQGTVVLRPGAYDTGAAAAPNATAPGIDLGGRNITIRSELALTPPERTAIRCLAPLGGDTGCFHTGACRRPATLDDMAAGNCLLNSIHIEGVLMHGGHTSTGTGGAVAFQDAFISLRRVMFANCTAHVGGGAHLRHVRGAALDQVSFVGCSAASLDASSTSLDDHGAGGGLALLYSLTVVNASRCAFRGCRAARGGAVVAAGSRILFAGCLFRDCHARFAGGGLFVDPDEQESALLVEDSVFEHLSADEFFFPRQVGYGGAIVFQGLELTIARSNATNCTSPAGTGGFLHASVGALSAGTAPLSPQNVAVLDSHFAACASSDTGGALFMDSLENATLHGAAFEGCASVQRAGGVYANGQRVLVEGSRFAACSSRVGGALYVVANSTLRDTQFQDCSANGSYGGAVYIPQGDHAIVSSAFRNCSAAQGGAIAGVKGIAQEGNNLRIYFLNSSATACSASQGGAIHLAGLGHLAIKNSTLARCTASFSGGGVDFSGYGELEVSGSSFDECSSVRGGGISVEPAALDTVYASTIVLSNFTRCSADGSDGGGAVFLESGASYSEITSCLFDSNSAAYGEGGAIVARGQVLTVGASHFYNNSARHNGGALSLADVNASVSESSIIGNSADYQGGGLYATGHANVTAVRTLFDSNEGQLGGAVMCCTSVVGALVSCNLTRNTAVLYGGATSANGNASLSAVGCHLANNSAYSGGAMYVTESATLRARASSFVDNRAEPEGDGGAIGTLSLSEGRPTEVHLAACRFEGNHAEGNGGVLNTAGDTVLVVTGGTFLGNSAGSSGGAAYLDDVSAGSFNGTSFAENKAPSAGGVALAGGAAAGFDSCTARGNSASVKDAGFLLVGGTAGAALANVTASGNQAAGAGGALAASASTELQVARSQFADNAARTAGGAIFVSGTNLTLNVTDSSFENNTAAAGGAIYQTGSVSGRISGCQLAHNSVGGGRGGGMQVTAVTPLPGGAGGGGLSLSGLNFSDNEADRGPAIFHTYSSSSQLFLACPDCATAGNVARGGGASQASSATGVRVSSDGSPPESAPAAAAPPPAAAGTAAAAAAPATAAGGGGSGGSNGALPVVVVTNQLLVPALRASLVDNFNNSVTPLATDVATVGPSDVFSGTLQVSGAGGAFVWTDVYIALNASQLLAYTSSATATTSRTNSSTSPSPMKSSEEAEPHRLTATVTARSPTGNFPGTISTNISLQFCSAGFYVSTSTSSTPPSPTAAATPTAAAANATSSTNTNTTVNATAAATASSTATTRRACAICPIGYYCPAAQPREACPAGTYSFAEGATSAADCTAIGRGLSAANGTFAVDPGFWVNPQKLAGAVQPRAFQCSVRGCTGGVLDLSQAAPPQCAPGYQETRLCAGCEHDHFLFLRRCHACSRTYKDTLVPALALTVAAWLLFALLSVAFESIDTVLVEMQLLVIIGSLNLNHFGGPTALLVRAYSVALFDLDFLGLQCERGSWSFSTRFTFTAILPLAAVALHVAFYALAALGHRAMRRLRGRRFDVLHPRASAERRLRALVRGVANCLDLLYLVVAVRCLQALQYSTYDARVLGADPAVVWRSPAHSRLIPFAAIYTGAYVVGYPLFVAWVLFRGRMSQQLGDRQYEEAWGGLYERYAERVFWWHLPMTSLRRLGFAFVFVFLVGWPELQGILLLIFTLLAICAQLLVRPYQLGSLNMLMVILLVSEFGFLVADLGYTLAAPYAATSAMAVAAVVVFLLCALLFFSYEVHTLWASHWVKRWARLHSDAPPSGAGVGGRRLVDSTRLVALEDVVAWFHPRVMSIFLRRAGPKELALLYAVRAGFSEHHPGTEEVESIRLLFLKYTPAFEYAAVAHLASSFDEEDGAGAKAGGGGGKDADEERGMGAGGKGGAGGGCEEHDEASGARRLDHLKMMAQVLNKEMRKESDSLAVLLRPRTLKVVAAWLAHGDEESRRSMTELVLCVRSYLLFSAPGLAEGGSLTSGEKSKRKSGLWQRIRFWCISH